jgi:predicted dehydrogenase
LDAGPRIALIGAGTFGRNHARVLNESSRARFAGVLDTNHERAAAIAQQYGCPVFDDIEELAAASDAAIVAVPTTLHAEIGCELLSAGIHVLVEKPIAADLDSAQRLVETAARARRILQVGHLERFNPAVMAAEQALTIPLFFEVHRLSMFTERSLDVDVVLDLMIHDIDVVLSMVQQMPEEVRAAGISVVTPKVDIANVRLAFPDGCIANLTASRVSVEKVRKLRLFQPYQYVSIDYARQDAFTIKISEQREVGGGPLAVEKAEPLKLQLESFVECIEGGRIPRAGGEDAVRALAVAREILDKIEIHTRLVEKTLHSRAS